MKKLYERPLAEPIWIRTQDVITASGGGIAIPGGGGDNETPDELNPFIP